MVWAVPSNWAYVIAKSFAWLLGSSLEEGIGHCWKRLAYATRYGNISLEEAASLGLSDMGSYLNALSEIVEEENKSGQT